jgi:cell division protein FtsI/penicillin-binding protein 2
MVALASLKAGPSDSQKAHAEAVKARLKRDLEAQVSLLHGIIILCLSVAFGQAGLACTCLQLAKIVMPWIRLVNVTRRPARMVLHGLL